VKWACGVAGRVLSLFAWKQKDRNCAETASWSSGFAYLSLVMFGQTRHKATKPRHFVQNLAGRVQSKEEEEEQGAKEVGAGAGRTVRGVTNKAFVDAKFYGAEPVSGIFFTLY